MKKNKLVVLAVAFVLVVGLKSVNVNAATTYAETLPETVTRGKIQYSFTSGTNAAEGYSNYPFYNEDTTGNYILYCADRKNSKYNEGDVLKKSSEKLPQGYAEILRSAFSNIELYGAVFDQASSKYTAVTDKNQLNTMLITWITQMALWGYQDSITENDIRSEVLKYAPNNSNSHIELFSAEDFSNSANQLNAVKVWREHVSTLIQNAKKAQDPSTATLSVTGDTKWTKSDNISKSGLITVASSNDLAGLSKYGVSLENAPEGTKIYTEDGTDITNNSSDIAANKKIYVTIDNSKIDKTKEYNFKINATGNLIYNSAYLYTSDSGMQSSVLVGPETKNVLGALDFKIVPDTASSISKTIYYIGFIILLSGAGIIYANIRPKKQESE